MSERIPNIHTLPYAALRPDPRNPNRMSPERYDAMKRHVEATGNCPNPLARTLPRISRFFDPKGGPVQYMLLDGHHRAKALLEIGFDSGPVDLWGEMSDDEAGVYLLTLNRNVGEDDPLARADLFADIKLTLNMDDIASVVPETLPDIEALLDMRQIALEIAPAEAGDEPDGDAAAVLGEETAIPVAFALYPEQHKVVMMALLSIQADMEGKNKPARALEEMSADYLAGLDPADRTQAEVLYLALMQDSARRGRAAAPVRPARQTRARKTSSRRSLSTALKTRGEG